MAFDEGEKEKQSLPTSTAGAPPVLPKEASPAEKDGEGDEEKVSRGKAKKRKLEEGEINEEEEEEAKKLKECHGVEEKGKGKAQQSSSLQVDDDTPAATIETDEAIASDPPEAIKKSSNGPEVLSSPALEKLGNGLDSHGINGPGGMLEAAGLLLQNHPNSDAMSGGGDSVVVETSGTR